MIRVSHSILMTALGLAGTAAFANVSLSAPFGEHMVLQRGAPAPIWGKAAANESLTVAFRGKTRTAVAGADGVWKTSLDASDAGGPFELTLTGKNTVTLKDVMVGEVWLASGQSNMAWTMKTLAGPNLDSAKNANHPDLRYMNMQAGGKWTAVTESTVLDFSGTAYYFSKELQTRLKVPVGILVSAVGGTDVERWMDEASIAADPAVAKDTVSGDLYQRFITPLLGYGIKGAIWYQGENNARDTSTPHPAWVVANYKAHFTAMIGGWRKAWKQGDFPFYYVQLPNINGAQGSPAEDLLWPKLREAQRLSLTTPNTAMVVTIDVGQANELHPPDKWDVGHRLALCARAREYGEKDLGYQYPMYESMQADGKSVRLFFRHAQGLATKGNAKVSGFAIAGADGKWAWGDAVIDKDTVIVSAASVAAPTQIRYGWGQNPPVSLYNRDGLPASPFQTNGPQLPVSVGPGRGNAQVTRAVKGPRATDALGRALLPASADARAAYGVRP